MELVGGYQLMDYANTGDAENRNYLIKPADTQVPAGYTSVYKDDTGAVYVKDMAQWNAVRYNPPTTDYRSGLYVIPRETLFPYKGVPAGNYNLNLGSLPLIWRLFSTK